VSRTGRLPSRAGFAAVLLLLLAACEPAVPIARPIPTASPTATPPGDARTVYVGADGVYALRPSDGALRWSYGVGPHAAAWMAGTVAAGAVYATVDGVLVALDAHGTAVRWRQPAGDRSSWGTPLAAGGVVYTAFAHAGDRYIDAVAALDASDGAVRWEFKTGGPIVAAPTYADGVVYVCSAGTDLYALRASDGAPLWRHRLVDAPGGAIGARAVEADGLVYVGAAVYVGQGDPKNPVSTWRYYLTALRASDGAEVWRSQVSIGASGSVEEPVVVAGGRVYGSVGWGRVRAGRALRRARLARARRPARFSHPPNAGRGRALPGSG